MDIYEYYLDGTTYSKHSGTQERLALPDNCIVLMVPRAFTPVCTQEIKDMEDHISEIKDMGFDVVFISTDSPEAWHACIAQDFDHDPTFPIGTVPVSGTNSGYFGRQTIWTVSGANVASYQVPDYMERDFTEIKRITKRISEELNGV